MEIVYSPDTISMSRNPIVYEVKTQNLQTKFLRLDLWIETAYESGEYTKLAQLSVPPDIDGKGIFYLDSDLDTALTPDYPSETDFEPQLHKNNCRRFKVEIGEDKNVLFSDEKLVLKGGFSFAHFAQRQAGEFIPNNTTFLTVRPRTRYISPYQREFISCIFPNAGNYTMTFHVHYLDDEPAQVYEKVLSVRAYEPILVPIGFPSQQYDQLVPGTLIARIEIWVGNDKIVLKPYRDDLPFYGEFYWLNSLGAWDSFFRVGAGKRILNVKQEEFRHYYPYNYKAISGEYQAFNPEMRTKRTARLGFVSRKEMFALQDFLSATIRLERIGNQFYPIKIDDGDYLIDDEDKNLQTLEIKYQYQFDELAIPPVL